MNYEEDEIEDLQIELQSPVSDVDIIRPATILEEFWNNKIGTDRFWQVKAYRSLLLWTVHANACKNKKERRFVPGYINFAGPLFESIVDCKDALGSSLSTYKLMYTVANFSFLYRLLYDKSNRIYSNLSFCSKNSIGEI